LSARYNGRRSMDRAPASAARWLFDSGRGASDRLLSRWLFLRALGFIYFSAFFPLVFQIRGLIGPQGILPANAYLQAVAHSFGTNAAVGLKRSAHVDSCLLDGNGGIDTGLA
jgi:hypothetical protein